MLWLPYSKRPNSEESLTITVGDNEAETSQIVEKRTLKKKWQKEDAGKVGSQTKVFETTDERLMECTAQSIITDWL